MRRILNKLENFFLLLIAIILFTVLSPVGVGYAIVGAFKKKVDLSIYSRQIAESIDQLGNAVMQYAFNKWLIKDGAYQFGNIDETVSSVLGKNLREGTLTKSGKFLNWFLNLMDPNHSLDAIEENP